MALIFPVWFPDLVVDFLSRKSFYLERVFIIHCLVYNSSNEAHLFVDVCAGGLLVVCLRPPERIAGCGIELSARKEKVCDCERQRTWTNSAQWLPKVAGESNPQPKSKYAVLFMILKPNQTKI